MNTISYILTILSSTGLLTVYLRAEDSVRQVDECSNVTSWPVGREFVRLGFDPAQPHHFGEVTGDYAWVEAPRIVVQAAKSVLAGKQKSWEVNKINDFDHTGKRVVLLRDRRNHHFICLAEKNRWIRLNEKRGLPMINKLLENNARSKPINSEAKRIIDYAQTFAFLYKGPQRIVLSKAFLNVAKTMCSMWLEGKEKHFEQLSRLCFDPIFTKDGHDVQIVFNIISDEGAVERWTLKGEQNRGLVIDDVTVETIRPLGTFSFGF